MGRQHIDKYCCFRDLSQFEREGKDFRIVMNNRGSDTTILAPHGGKIESGTSEIAEAIAGSEFNLYCFEGIKRNRNYETLHITSHRFDEPKCLKLLAHSRVVFAIHGCNAAGRTIFVGGRNATMRRELTLQLRDAGFSAQEESRSFPGEEENNICNRGATKEGIQLELTKGLRNSFMMMEFMTAIRSVIPPRQEV